MVKKSLFLMVTLTFFFMSGSAQGFLFFKKKKAPKTSIDSTKTKKETDYEKLFKEKHLTVKGLITLHNVKGKLYFELPITLLNKEMLIGSTVSQISNNANAIVGSKPSAPLYVEFTKQEKNVQLRSINSNYISNNEDSNIAKAIDQSTIGAVIKNMKISAYSPDSLAIVFDMTDFFVSDNKEMSPFDQLSLYAMSGYKRTESYQRDKSFLGEIKAFSDNVTIQSHLSYTYSLKTADGKDAAKDVPFTAVVTRSIMLLKDKPYRPRYGDYRMAIFPTGKYLLNENDQAMRATFFSNRWDLTPSDKDAYLRKEKVEPQKPIVFYIDNTFPEKWKKYIKEGVEQWNEVFEEIGFKNTILAKDFPQNDSVFDPDNLKYSCIRYAPIGIANAMGPSWTDPRSGEIITASVYVYHNIIELLNNWIFVQTAQTVNDVRRKKIPDEIIGDGLRYVIAHEIGHCLGLMHNMSGSAVFPVDSLRSPTFTQKYGTTSSIMDYARYNYVAQQGDYQKGVKMTPPRFGEYDKFSIKWLYTAFPDKTYEEESNILSQWITERSGDFLYHYGKQQIYWTYDPRSQVEDLGDDAMKASEYGIRNLEFITYNLDSWVHDDDEDYSYRKKIYNAIIQQYIRYIGHVYANVGGLYLQEIKKGDKGDMYQSVPKDIQKKALMFIIDQVGNHSWFDNLVLRGKIGISSSVNDLIDNYLIKRIVSAPQKVVVSSTLADSNPYSFKECADDVYNFIWKSTISGRKPSSTDMMMQREFINQFMINSHLIKEDPTEKKSFTSDIQIAEELGVNNSVSFTCSCGSNHTYSSMNENNMFSPVSGYEWGPEFRLFYPMATASDSFGYVLRVQSLLERNIPSSGGETRAHYEFLLNQIENSLTIK
ncbi:zinc-dependent metalloprotease [Dysgonomonas sp. Marseille-P4677]|uniref:zinc-dependent metalloprotease n=1 Tax=Dysgonomonas sp. Marseille-P4677 TaxID=2364790 RepID=UPI00191443D6|nr:zinc-dependent metalloprotease [Dysgonomonas sp. Marseille-P4677]